MATEDSSNYLRLHKLCSLGKFDDIFNHLEKTNSAINTYDRRGYAPIHYAMGRDSADIERVLALLFTHGVDVNLRTLCDGDTALHIAVARFEGGDAVVMALSLLSLGADCDYRNDNHRTPYDIAMAKGNLHLAEVLESGLTQKEAADRLKQEKVTHYGNKLIHMIKGHGTQDDVDACLEQGCNPDYIDKNGAGAIHYTITHSPLEKLPVLQSLVNAKADVNLLTYENDNALNLVIKSENLRPDDQMYLLAGKLLKWGSRSNQKDLDGKNALDLARERKYQDVVSLILTHSAFGDKPSLHKRQTKQIELAFKGKKIVLNS